MFRRITFRVLALPLTMALVVVAAASLYWLLYVQARTAYLTSRNLRVLETFGGYIESSLESNVASLDSFLRLSRERQNNPAARDHVPLVGLLERAPLRAVAVSAADAPPLAPFYLADPETGTNWVVGRRRPAARRALPAFRVPLDQVLDPIFRDELAHDVFEDVVVATTDGRVLFQRAAAGLKLQNLSTLQLTVEGERGEPASFAMLAGTTTVARTTIAGSAYLLFIQPCCLSLRAADGSGQGWVVTGLLPAARLSYRSSALSVTLLAPLILVTLGLFLAWPFLKIGLLGRHDSVRIVDATALGAAGLIAVSMLTIAMLDAYAVRGFSHGLDQQLIKLSHALRDQFDRETTAAVSELRALETAIVSRPEFADWVAGSTQEVRQHDRYERLVSRLGATDYPFFEAFALAHDRGRQAAKWSAFGFLTPLISVNEREYYTHWRTRDSATGEAFFLQSVRSLTTGRKQAVVSRPASGALREAGGSKRPPPGEGGEPRELAMSSLTIPMLSVVRPVLAAGFGYAVIDPQGRVQFHSDAQHNLEEQFFVESDQNRTLRAAVAARRPDHVHLTYWGGEYRAYVAPLAPDPPHGQAGWRNPWTLVTFYDKAVFRGVHLEWLLTACLFLVLHVTLYLLVAGALLLRRHYVAGWLWPDRRRLRTYRRLATVGVLFIVAAGSAIWVLHDVHALAIAALVPLLSWALCYVVLTTGDPSRLWRRLVAAAFAAALLLLAMLVLRRDGGDDVWIVAAPLVAAALLALWEPERDAGNRRHGSSWRAVAIPYCLLAAVMLVLTGVVPALAAFRVARTIQLEAFVKSRQLKLAGDIQARRSRMAEHARAIGKPGLASHGLAMTLGNYATAFLGSDLTAHTCPTKPPQAAPGHELRRFIERLLPYFSEASVEMRRLLNDGSTDDWHWRCSTPGEPILHALKGEGGPVSITSHLDLLRSWPEHLRAEQRAVAVLACVLPLALVWAVVRFIARRIFLVDLRTLRLPDARAAPAPAWAAPAGPPDARPDGSFRATLRGGRAHLRRWLLDRLVRPELADDHARPIWDRLGLSTQWLQAADSSDVDIDAVVDEAVRAATPDYRSLWASCSDEQKLVLEHLAQHGLVNEKSRATIQQLLAMRLIRRAPQFVLATETLRRFVLGQECRRDVKVVEAGLDASVWDRVRAPLFVSLAVACAFFVITQQQVVTETVSLIMGVVGGLPALLQLIGAMSEKRGEPVRAAAGGAL